MLLEDSNSYYYSFILYLKASQYQTLLRADYLKFTLAYIYITFFLFIDNGNGKDGNGIDIQRYGCEVP